MANVKNDIDRAISSHEDFRRRQESLGKTSQNVWSHSSQGEEHLPEDNACPRDMEADEATRALAELDIAYREGYSSR